MRQITDLRLIETGDGGDCVLKGNDLELISGFQNMPYIGLFGGNYVQSTTGPKNTEQAFDFWGNFLINPTLQDIWFNSETERLLNNVALSPSGRIQIEEQVKQDLKFMQKFAQITVSVVLFSIDRIRIEITILEPSTQQSNQFIYIWDATNAELTQQGITEGSAFTGIGLDNPLELDL
jgi:hypothetical protein